MKRFGMSLCVLAVLAFGVVTEAKVQKKKAGGGAHSMTGCLKKGDGNTFTLSLCGTRINDNVANEGGGAVFFVSNDQSGHLIIKDSTLSHNPSKKFETQGFPGIFVLASGAPQVSGSILQK